MIVAPEWGAARRRKPAGAAETATAGTHEHAEEPPDEHAATRGRPPGAETHNADREAGAELGAARAGGPIKRAGAEARKRRSGGDSDGAKCRSREKHGDDSPKTQTGAARERED